MLPQILEEVPKVREDTGFVPLVTPTSQIVGTQASFNILTGQRYGMISNEFRALMSGRYGRTPGPPNPEVVKQACPDGQLYTERPANYVERINLEKIYEENGELIQSHRDLLLMLLFPGPAKAFLEKNRK